MKQKKELTFQRPLTGRYLDGKLCPDCDHGLLPMGPEKWFCGYWRCDANHEHYVWLNDGTIFVEEQK
jgi:hypothetical protein